MKHWFVFLSLLLSFPVCAQQHVHVNAHAHNDYAHKRPLFEALENGFTSVEADVHLVNGKLFVSHDRPDATAKTLDDLYLRPLDSIRLANGGKIYSGHGKPVVLMIDIKTDGEATGKILQQVLSSYKECLNTAKHPGAVQVVISGNRPVELIKKDPEGLMTIDGRPGDLGRDFSPAVMPVISENYSKVISWNGQGTPSKKDLQTLKELSRKVHREGKKLRLWAIPDNQNAWKVLLNAGVDIINTDKLKDLNLFLTENKL